MKAVILAAGRGSRLKPITNHVHKTLIEIGPYPILEWQIRNYYKAGVGEIYVVTGYRGEEVMARIEYMNDELYGATTVTAIQSSDWDVTDNLYSLYLAEKYVRGDEFVLSNGDVFADAEIFGKLCSGLKRAIVPYDSKKFDPEALKLELKDEVPSGILDKGKQNGAGATIGMFSFNKKASEALFADIETHIDIEGEKTQWFEASLDRIFATVDFDALDVSLNNWVEVDSVEDIMEAWKIWGGEQADATSYIQSLEPLAIDHERERDPLL